MINVGRNVGYLVVQTKDLLESDFVLHLKKIVHEDKIFT
jgi:hypothetical protein